MRATFAAFTLLSIAQTAFAKINVHYVKSFLATKGTSPFPEQLLELPIDHSKPEVGTFKNRWWFNDTLYEPGGPVIILDVGEQDAEPLTSFLSEPAGVQTAVMQLAQKYHGIGVIWEHRYFGDSVPFVQDGKAASVSALTGEQWSYLTFEQALEDVVVFANNFTLPSTAAAFSKLKSPDALHASKTPFIFVGGSYPGVRASALRIRNPETIFASWASSAPVQASINMASYYRAVARGLPSNCSADFAAGIKFFDSAVTGSDATLESSVKNGIISAANNRPVSIASTDAMDDATVGEFITPVWGDYQTGGPAAVQAICDAFETDGGKVASSAGGLGSQVTSQQLFASLTEAVQTDAQLGTTGTTNGELVSLSQPELLAPESSASNIPADALSWMWMFCSEFGYFQVADSSNSIITSLETIDRMQARCNAAFPGMLPPAPQVDAINKKYGGWTQNPTRVMYTNGELDPWKTLSVASVEDGAPMRLPTTTVPPADGAPNSKSYYGVIYPGQVHAVDFFSSTGQPDARNKAFQTGLSMFTAALDQWMGSFKAGSDPNLSSIIGGAAATAAATGTDTAVAPGNTAADSSNSNAKDNKKNGAASQGVSVSMVVGVMTILLGVLA
jgi:hypothetical protein